MSDLSIEMKEFAFQAAVQAAAKRASEACGNPSETAASVADAAIKAAELLGLATPQNHQPSGIAAHGGDQ